MRIIIYLLLFLIISGLFGFMFFSYENKIRQLKREVMLANSHISNLRTKLNKNSKDNSNEKSNLSLKFINSKNKTGIINEKINVYIAPIKNSYLLFKTSVKMEVNILDCAEIYNTLWYYVQLPIDSNINSRGWVKKEDFTLFYDKNKNLSKI